jgi:DNA-binding SARP family transcriptional activator
MEFCLLGPLLVRNGESAVSIRPGKQQALLAALVLSANRPVVVDEIAEVLWGSNPPAAADGTIRTYVLRLRQALGDAERARLRAAPNGYVISVSPGELDVTRFEALARSVAAAVRNGRWQSAAADARGALALWRGEPLADIGSAFLVTREVPRLAEMRLQLLQTRIEADLLLGRPAAVVTELAQLADANPLREQLHALLMLALYRCGRQAEALAAFQKARQVLVEEVGAEPGTELREMHQRILRGDPVLSGPGPDSVPGIITMNAVTMNAAAPVIPRELPAPVPRFTGRRNELAILDGLIAQDLEDGPGTVVISAIGGIAGVGKTALAVHWAHQAAERFPDGQLYVNLHGYDPGQPVPAADALARFLRSLGVLGQDIPAEEEERSARYRSLLAGKQMLVVLDNASTADQVRPLLPGDPGCAVLVTSRDTLAGLVAADGACRVDLGPLPLPEAVALLRSLIGGRADDDPEATAQLAGLCAGLPLALRIAAELAVARRPVPLRELAAELAADRLDCLDADEDPAGIRAVFSWSCRQLPGDVARAFALAGLHPGEDLDVHAVAALAGTTAGQARRAMSRLHRASMVQVSGPGRYTMHDLLRAYAREQAAARDTDGSCHRALTCLFDFYLAAAAAATDLAFPAVAHRRPRVAAVAADLPAMADPGEARAWLDQERANLVAAAVHSAGHGWVRHAADLAATLYRYLITGGHLPEAETIFASLLPAARQCGDLAAEAGALYGLGSIGIEKGRLRDAAGHCQAALELYRRCGDRTGQALALHNLGVAAHLQNSDRSAAGYYREAVAAYEDTGDRLGAATASCNLACVEIAQGSLDQASVLLQRALPVFRDQKDQQREAEALSYTGELRRRRGELTQAAALFEQALAIYRTIDYPYGIANALRYLGEVSLDQRDFQQAISYLQQALTLFRQTGDQFGEVFALRTLARTLHQAGRPAAARTELVTALNLATQTGNTHQLASTHQDLAESQHHDGQDEQARYHWQQALTLYTQLSAPEADHIRAQLGTG